MNLNVLKTYAENFPGIRLGLSDHQNGIDAGPIAYMLGARVFEKHFTLNRTNKGTDNVFSLEPQGLKNFVRNILRIEKIMSCFRDLARFSIPIDSPSLTSSDGFLFFKSPRFIALLLSLS